MTASQLDYAAVAARAGVVVSTLRRYASQGRMPAPDGRVGGSPWWWDTTITAWLAARPGARTGGGRPRKS